MQNGAYSCKFCSRLADDSDLTEETDESNSNTPQRQKSPEPAPLVNGTDSIAVSNETDLKPETNGVHEKSEEVVTVKPKKKLTKTTFGDKKKLTKTKSNEQTNGVLTETNGIAGDNSSEDKSKKLPKKKKSAKTGENIEAKTNGVDEESNGFKNGAAEDSNHTNGSNNHTNGYTAEDELNKEENKYPEIKKKKKMVKRHVYEQSDVQCKSCGHYADRHTLREYRSAIGFTIERLKDMKEDAPSELFMKHNKILITV